MSGFAFFSGALIPAWAKGNKKVTSMFVYPCDTGYSLDLPFQLPIRRQRCLIPADGYYMEKSTVPRDADI